MNIIETIKYFIDREPATITPIETPFLQAATKRLAEIRSQIEDKNHAGTNDSDQSQGPQT